MCFLGFAGLWKKKELIYGNSDLKSKKGGKNGI
jgi:hypothetical protein